MKKLLVIAALIAAFTGCKSTPQNDSKDNAPIVSPTVISTDKAENDEPQLPTYVPWWVEQK